VIFTDFDEIVLLEVLLAYRPPIDPGTVGTTLILDDEAPEDPLQRGVMAAHGLVLEADAVVLISTYGSGLLSQLKLLRDAFLRE
jgi:hypothetical protein